MAEMLRRIKKVNGVRYELILKDAWAIPPARFAVLPSTWSARNIEEKLRAADERRASLKASKVAALAARLHRNEEVAHKKNEQTRRFIADTKKALDQKMFEHWLRREGHLTDIHLLMKEDMRMVAKARWTKWRQTEKLRQSIEERLEAKLENAQTRRELLNLQRQIELAWTRQTHFEQIQRNIEFMATMERIRAPSDQIHTDHLCRGI